VYSRRRRPGWHVARARTTLNVMNARAKKLLDELLTLSVEDRALIAVELEASIEEDASPEEIEKMWAEEIERRVKDVVEGRSRGIPAQEAFAQIRARLAASRPR
jgi:putative addiction module component (TIGR02574 family)